MVSLTGIFDQSAQGLSADVGYQSRGTPDSSLTGFFNMSSEPETNTGQHRTMLASLTGGQSFKVNATQLQTVSLTQDNVAGQVGVRRAEAKALDQDVSDMKGAMIGTIKQAQQQIYGAMKSAGVDMTAFMDRRMAASAVEATSGGVTGASMTSLLDAVYSDLRGKPGADEVLAQIESHLRTQSPSGGAAVYGFQNQQSVVAAPAEGGLDWNSFFDDGHSLKEFMALKPDDPSTLQALLPEYRELDQIDVTVQDVLNQLNIVEDELKRDPIIDRAYVRETLGYLDGVTVSALPAMDRMREVGNMMPSRDNEPKNVLNAQFDMSAASGM